MLCYAVLCYDSLLLDGQEEAAIFHLSPRYGDAADHLLDQAPHSIAQGCYRTHSTAHGW